MSSNCNIIIGFEDSAIRDLNVTVATETGYVTID